MPVPILEHLLLLAEYSPIEDSAIECCLQLLSNGVVEQIRLALYVYALFDSDKPVLEDKLKLLFSEFYPEDVVYLKRFVQVTVNVNAGRNPSLFSLLDIIWRKGDWNVRYNVIELLDYLVQKAPTETIAFLRTYQIIEESIEACKMRPTKKQHEPSLKDLARILVHLANYDLKFALYNLKEIARVDDPPINLLRKGPL